MSKAKYLGLTANQLAKIASNLESENAKLRAARDTAVEDAKSIIVMLSNARAENARLRSELESVGTAAYLYGRGDLKAENAKLRERVAELEELLPDSGRWYRAETVEAYVAEIAKLRELARGLGQCAQGVGCEDCLLYDLSEPEHCREERLSRELGIEVEA